MEIRKEESFDVYIEKFKNLKIEDKRKLTIDEIKKIIALFEKLNSELNQETKMLFNKEILDLNKDNYTEDDYLEAIFVYINTIQELLADYINNQN